MGTLRVTVLLVTKFTEADFGEVTDKLSVSLTPSGTKLEILAIVSAREAAFFVPGWEQ